MQNPLRHIGNIFDVQSAVEGGWAYKHPKPVLSPEKRKALMESSSLETPRSSLRAVLGIITPYWTKSTLAERATAATLLATSLFMTWYAVQVTVEFGNWQSGLTNTVQQLFQTMMASRPEIMTGLLPQFPDLQQALSDNTLLNTLLMKYPDTTSVLQDPAFKELLTNNPGFVELLEQNPTMENVFKNFPGLQDKLAANPELMKQVGSFNEQLSGHLMELPKIKQHLSNLLTLCGGDFIKTWGSALSNTFNSVTNWGQNGELLNKNAKSSMDLAWQSMSPKAWGMAINDTLSSMSNYMLDEKAKESVKAAWSSKDLATIALKYTAMAIISYKSAQYLALRWRGWTTGYYTNKWLDSKSYARLKNTFNNIDNPGQRIQEDPNKFTDGAVSLMTGVMGAGMTLASFSGMLWGMGTMYGVPGGMFWLSTAYASTLTALTVGAGHKLTWIQRNQQRREADLRSALDKVNNNADVIAQNDGEDLENDLIKKRFKPVMTNSVREISTQVKLIVVDATAGNLSIPIPWIAGAFAVAAGTASMGTIQTLNYAFNRVTSSLSFIVNRFGQLSQMKATADRIYTFDQAIDAAHYIEEEKRQAGLVQSAEEAKKLHTGGPVPPQENKL